MSTRSTRVVSVKPNSDSTTRSKSKKSTLSRAYNSLFGPSKSKLESIARFRSLIEQCDESLNKFIDRNQPDTGGHIARILDLRNTYYDKLSDATRLTAEDIAADEAIHARIKEYHAYQRQIWQKPDWRQSLAGTRKRRKHRKYKKH